MSSFIFERSFKIRNLNKQILGVNIINDTLMIPNFFFSFVRVNNKRSTDDKLACTILRFQPTPVGKHYFKSTPMHSSRILLVSMNR